MRLASKLFALVVAVSLAGSALAADKTGTIKGKVTGQDGKPVAAGVNVRVVPATPPAPKAEAPSDKVVLVADKPAETPADKPAADEKKPAAADEKKPAARPTPVATSKTDDKGEFTIADVPPGEYRVASGGRDLGNGFVKVTVKAGETVTADITLKAPKAK